MSQGSRTSRCSGVGAGSRTSRCSGVGGEAEPPAVQAWAREAEPPAVQALQGLRSRREGAGEAELRGLDTLDLCPSTGLPNFESQRSRSIWQPEQVRSLSSVFSLAGEI